MTVELHQFIKELEDSGIVAGDTLKDFLPPNASPKDAEELARELVRQKKLTEFQAEEISKGKGKSLVLGNYVLMEKIGAGGMGQVFKANHRRMDRLVAVKLLPTTMTKNNAAIARFEREVKAAAKISHPNIVAAHDADCANGVHFLVMELVEGNNLSSLVKMNGPFSIEKAVNYVLQAAKGLEAAHTNGIVHRDIKPSNLMLDSEGAVKILDLGLARMESVGDVPAQAELTDTGTILGTVDYMAPEQALNTKTADARADIYSLGCSLYYFLTGKPTYEGGSLMKRLLAHRENPIPSLRAIRSEVPELVETVFKKMIAKKVENRYQTMTEVIATLDGCSKFQSKTTNTQPQLESSARFIETISLEKPLTAANLVQMEKADEPRPSKDRKKLLIGIVALGMLMLLAGLLRMTTNGEAPTGTNPLSVAESPRKPLAFQTPGFDQWVNEVAKLTPEKQVEAVSRKLMDLNPGFDGKMTGSNKAPEPLVESGVVTELGFVTDNVTDISPVRALAGLKILWCVGSERGKGQLADLSPLKGMTLNSVVCNKTNVSDLSPLAGMELYAMECSFTQVSNLSPLKGMPLGWFSCSGTPVADISVLHGMHLLWLNIHNTQVSDLSALRGMPLTVLYCLLENVTDYSPLKELPLKTLSFKFNPDRDTELLRSIKTLETINEKPAAEFRKEVEESQKGEETWVPNARL